MNSKNITLRKMTPFVEDVLNRQIQAGSRLLVTKCWGFGDRGVTANGLLFGVMNQIMVVGAQSS